MKNKYVMILLFLVSSFVSVCAEPTLTYTVSDPSILVGTALSGNLRYDSIDWGRSQFTGINISVQPVGQVAEEKRIFALYPVRHRRGEFFLHYSSARGSGLKGFPGAFARSPETGEWTFIFEEPGTYRVRFHLERYGTKISSNSVEVEVKAPTGKNRDAWESLPAQAYVELLTYNGPSGKRVRDLEITNMDDYKTEVLNGYRALQSQGVSFAQWLRKHKDSVYASQIVGGIRGKKAPYFPDRKAWNDVGVPFPDWIDEANRLLREIPVTGEPLIIDRAIIEKFHQKHQEEVRQKIQEEVRQKTQKDIPRKEKSKMDTH